MPYDPSLCTAGASNTITVTQGSSYLIETGCQGTPTTTCVGLIYPWPSHGTVRGEPTWPNFRYTPKPGFQGQDSFTIEASECQDFAYGEVGKWKDLEYTVNVVPPPTPSPTPSPTAEPTSSPTSSPTASPTASRSFICASSIPGLWNTHYGGAMIRNGELLTIPDQATQTYIENNFAANQYWIGLNDRTAEGTFTWDDGDLSTYRNWYDNSNSANEDCVSTHASNWKWDVVDCNTPTPKGALVEFPWSEYNKIVCHTSHIYNCRPGPGNTFDYESCSQTAPVDIVDNGDFNDNDKKLDQGSIIGGSIAIGAITIMSLMALIYLGRKNQWSWCKKRFNRPQPTQEEKDEKDVQQNGSSSDKLSSPVDTEEQQEESTDIENEQQEESTDIENC